MQGEENEHLHQTNARLLDLLYKRVALLKMRGGKSVRFNGSEPLITDLNIYKMLQIKIAYSHEFVSHRG